TGCGAFLLMRAKVADPRSLTLIAIAKRNRFWQSKARLDETRFDRGWVELLCLGHRLQTEAGRNRAVLQASGNQKDFVPPPLRRREPVCRKHGRIAVPKNLGAA